MKADLVLDVRTPKSRNVRFYPAGITLRGEVEYTQCQTRNPALQYVGGRIPGMRMEVDTKSRTVRIVDRMSLPESKEIDRALRELSNTERYSRFKFGRYEDEQVYNVAERDWPTWLWHIRRLVDHGRLHIVSGQNNLPSPAKIAMMGTVRYGDSVGVDGKNGVKYWEMSEEEALELQGAGT